MQVTLRGNRVAVEKINKASKEKNWMVVPDSEEYLGIIRFLGQDAKPDLVIGQKVYYATNFQKFRMAGSELCVMEDSNVLAISEDQSNSES